MECGTGAPGGVGVVRVETCATTSSAAATLTCVGPVRHCVQVWDAVRGRSSVDYLWSTGATPFGPFSSSLHLSFAIVDAAARHMVLGAVHALSNEVAQLLEHFSVRTAV